METFCSNCGEKLPENANFCLKCGVRTRKGKEEDIPTPYLRVDLTEHLEKIGKEIDRALSKAGEEMERAFTKVSESIKETTHRSPIVCASCGEENPWDSRFCHKCGEKLR